MSLGPEQCLISSIILESTSTCLLKNAVNTSLYYIPAYLGYIVSFYLFPTSLEKYFISFAYTLRRGIGILFTFFLQNNFLKYGDNCKKNYRNNFNDNRNILCKIIL